MIQAVIFDFDGVIGDTMKDNCLAWQKAFSSHGYEIEALEYYKLEGMGRYQIANYFIDKYKLNPSIKTSVVEAKENNYKANNTFKIYDHVGDIFALLNSKKIKTAIVTGASKERMSNSLDTVIANQISALITADDVINTKPNPEPYLKAVSKLNIEAKNCLVIENAILGIESAKAAKCKCFALETTLTKKELSLADEIFSSHKELLIKFETLFNN